MKVGLIAEIGPTDTAFLTLPGMLQDKGEYILRQATFLPPSPFAL